MRRFIEETLNDSLNDSLDESLDEYDSLENEFIDIKSIDTEKRSLIFYKNDSFINWANNDSLRSFSFEKNRIPIKTKVIKFGPPREKHLTVLNRKKYIKPVHKIIKSNKNIKPVHKNTINKDNPLVIKFPKELSYSIINSVLNLKCSYVKFNIVF